MNIILFKSNSLKASVAIVALFGACLTAAQADTVTSFTASPRVLQQALATEDGLTLYENNTGQGLNLSGGLFSGRASGIDPAGTNYVSGIIDNNSNVDRTAELEGDPRVHALMIDGSYNFDNHLGTGLPLHPYLSSGVGLAMYDQGSSPTATSLASQTGSTVPLFRVGGGVSYQLGAKWDMSLDYKAGFTGGSNAVFTSGNQQTTDMQTVNIGMHYQF